MKVSRLQSVSHTSLAPAFGTENSYVVKSGDTIWKIAEKSGLRTASQIHEFYRELLRLNIDLVLERKGLDLIYPGDVLQIPSCDLDSSDFESRVVKSDSSTAEDVRSHSEDSSGFYHRTPRKQFGSSFYGQAVCEHFARGFVRELITEERGRVSSHFGHRHDPLHGDARAHKGIDIALAEGTSIQSPEDGVVTRSGYDEDGYGYWIEIEHPSGERTRYAHLSRRLVRRGDLVEQGQLIGLSGSTGRATGPHLHFEVRRMDATGRYQAVDPMALA